LLGDELDSEFAVNTTDAHTRIARVCLEYLTGDELKPPRAGGGGSGSIFPRSSKKSEFFAYAVGGFSSHLARSDPESDHVLALIDKFLGLNILAWIEKVAETKSFGLMLRAAEDLRVYGSPFGLADRRPLGHGLQKVWSWSVDLHRVAARFADVLITSPSAIYSLIPPFCPKRSEIHRITTPWKHMSVVGSPLAVWDDRLSCLDFGDDDTTAMCYGKEFLAVGLEGGRVALYHPGSCQEFRSLDHGERVMHLQFREESEMLASSGMKQIRIWDVRTGQQLYQLRPPSKCLQLVFWGNLLMAALDTNEIFSWDLDDEAAEQAKRPRRGWANDGQNFLNCPPSAISIAVARRLMAVAYGRPLITIWDLEQDARVGTCGKKLPSGEGNTRHVRTLLLNPNPNIDLLAVSYYPGEYGPEEGCPDELVIIDPFADIEVEKQLIGCHTLAASRDGRLLAGGERSTVIRIFEFNTLKLLYKVESSDQFIACLTFSADGAKLADLEGSQCNIWTPPVLLVGASSGYATDMPTVDPSSPSLQTTNSVQRLPQSYGKAIITVMVLMPDNEGIICGQNDGSVCVYDINSGNQTTKLYSHQDAVVTLCWLPWANTAISTSRSKVLLAWSLEKSTHAARTTWTAATLLMKAHLTVYGTIRTLLPQPGQIAGKFILTTIASDHLWNLGTGKKEYSTTRHIWYPVPTWLQHPRSQSHVICVKENMIHIHRWKDLSEVTSVSLPEGSRCNLTLLNAKRAFPCVKWGSVLLDLRYGVYAGPKERGTDDLLFLGCIAGEVMSSANSREGEGNDIRLVLSQTASTDEQGGGPDAG
jgi:WD40 repeat protein